MKSTPLPSPGEASPLLAHLLRAMPDSRRTRIKELLQSGRVHVNGRSVTKHDLLVSPKDRLELRDERAVPTSRELPFPILFEDAHLIVVHKPNGMLTVGSKHEKSRTVYSLVNRALSATRERAYVVHRLDLYTSGALVLAKSEAAQEKLRRRWGDASKVYHALVEGTPARAHGQLTHYLREDERLVMRATEVPQARSVKAMLSFKVEKSRGPHSLLRVELKTGKKNQIRAQLAAIGHPIVGDLKYGATSNVIGRLALHASQLRLPHPTTGIELCLQAPLPDSFQL